MPSKLPKPAKPTRFGDIYVARRADGAWLVERRPDKGLLGGMLGWPGSDWNSAPNPNPPIAANWQSIDQQVRHTFTHFHLILSVQTAALPLGAKPDTGFFLPEQDFSRSDLPTVMRKAFDLCQNTLHPANTKVPS